MSTIFFPKGLSVNLHNLNMEEMEFYARAWNLNRLQMQKGTYLGSMVATHTPRIQLMYTPHSHGILLQGDFPKGTVLIAWVQTNADVTFQDTLAQKYKIKILKSGDEIDFLCNGESETFTLAVEEKFFYESYYLYFGEDFHLHKKDKDIYIDPKLFSSVTLGFKRWLNYLLQDHKTLGIEHNYAKIENQILIDIFSSIYLDDKQKYRQKFDKRIIRNILHNSVENLCSISDIAQECNISQRLLFQTFKDHYGITPKSYLLALRLNLIRKELIDMDNEKTNISSIIEKYTFFNASTFTQSYKQMFGELPSQTLPK